MNTETQRSGAEEIRHEYLIKQVAKHLCTVLGYPEEGIIKIIHDVIIAQKAVRQKELEEYRNKRVQVNLEGLKIDCFVHDVKYVNGEVSYQVKPVSGDGALWVRRHSGII